MDLPKRAIAIASLLGLLPACEGSYMPLGDSPFIMRAVLSRNLFDLSYQIVFCQPDGSVCGRRKVDPELYEMDTCWSEGDSGDVEIPFNPTGFSNNQIEAGYFGFGDVFEADGFVHIRCNDFGYADIDHPPGFLISAPKPDATIVRSAQSSIRVEWSSGGSDFTMRWKLIPADDELEVLPCDMLPWENFEQQGPDMGFAEIPMDIIPANLPAEGCEAILSVSRTKDIALPEGISKGSITSSVVDGLVFRILP